MGEVEEMIGELEDDPDEEEPSKAEPTEDEEPEEGFGLDLDKAWNSPDEDS